MAAKMADSVRAVVPLSGIADAEKINYKCLVRDETQTNITKQRINFSIQSDSSISKFCSEVARRLDYEESTFLLVWEKPSETHSTEDVILDAQLAQNLAELGLSERRNNFLVREKDGRPPVTIINKRGGGEMGGTFMTASSSVVGSRSTNYSIRGIDAERTKYKCAVYDETQLVAEKQKATLYVQSNATVSFFYLEVARQLDYEDNTFVLAWEKPSDTSYSGIEVILDPRSSRTLTEVGLTDRRNGILLKNKNDYPPVKRGERCGTSSSAVMSAGSRSTNYSIRGIDAERTKYRCAVFDETQTAAEKQNTTLYVQSDATVSFFYSEVASQLDYEDNTFVLAWEKPSETSYTRRIEEVILDPKSSQTLTEVGLTDRRNGILLKDKSGHPPVKRGEMRGTSVTEASTTSHTAQYNENNNFSSGYSYANAVSSGWSDTGLVGLVNQAMTCYLNSLLQSLYMTPEFRNALYAWKPECQLKDEETNIPFQLQKLFVQLQTTNKRSIETTDVTKSFGWDSNDAWQQHDVQELCRVMFDALEVNWTKTEKANLINVLYQGKMQDYVKCHECRNESVREATYLDIALDIKPFGAKKACESVEEALEVFITPETLDGNNQYFCEKCQKKCDADKGLKFLSFPYLLTLQLKRFAFDFTTFGRVKLNDKVTFPVLLDLNKFLSRKGQDAPALTKIKRSLSMREEEGEGEEIEEDKDTDNEKESTDVDVPSPADSPAATAAKAGADGIGFQNNHDSTSSAGETPLNEKEDGSVQDEAVSKGPFVYELFSIMVHSGSAIGGHYYAYIKSFKDGQWYCFNDQSVARASWDDITRTFGGSERPSYYYSSVYSSSANAYMLMYRQKDNEAILEDVALDREFWDSAAFPDHIRVMQNRIRDEEEAEKRQKELDKSLCKLKLFCHHPKARKLKESKFEIHEEALLSDATKKAWELLGLEDCVPLDCCRLVKYDDYYETLEKSYDGEEDTPVGKLFGGVKAFYHFDLLLETKTEEQSFKLYKPGGVTLRVYLVDLDEETVSDPKVVRAHSSDSVSELTKGAAEALCIPHEKMRLCTEACYKEIVWLNSPGKTLKSEGFFRNGKVFAEAKGEDDVKMFPDSRLFKFLNVWINSFRVNICFYFTEDEDADKEETENGQASKKPGVKEFSMRIDRRMSLEVFKERVGKEIGLSPEKFRVFRSYGNNQEFESTRLDEAMSSFPDDCTIIIRAGRALKPGEYRVKMHSFDPYADDHFKFMFDWIIVKGSKVLEYKAELVKELERKKIEVSLDRLRIRKKHWQNPGPILFDDQVFSDDINLYNNVDMLYEILLEPEQMRSSNQLSLYIRRWRPSTFTLDSLEEIVIDFSSPKRLKEKISSLSDIPSELVEFAKGRGTFPCNVSVLEIQEELEWNPNATSLNTWPLYIHEDGAVIYYRDKSEKSMVLSEERRRQIQKEENAKYANLTKGQHTSYRKEKALKIYTATEQSSQESSPPMENAST